MLKDTTLLKAEFDTKEWHDIRAGGLGGSDAAAALGISKFKSAYQLWLEKTGKASSTINDNWDMARGRALEPIIRQAYSDATGRSVMLLDGVLRHNEYPFMFGNFDGLTNDSRLLEIKAPRYNRGWGETGSDEIPSEYMIQVQHYLFITGYEVGDVAVSFGGAAPVYYEVAADAELQEQIIAGEHEFWSLVQSDIPPEPKTAEDVASYYKTAKASKITASEDVLSVLSSLKTSREAIKSADERKEEMETEIKLFMGENDTLVDIDGIPLITWKNAKGAERLDAKAIKENEPDIYERYLKIGEPNRRFLVK